MTTLSRAFLAEDGAFSFDERAVDDDGVATSSVPSYYSAGLSSPVEEDDQQQLRTAEEVEAIKAALDWEIRHNLVALTAVRRNPIQPAVVKPRPSWISADGQFDCEEFNRALRESCDKYKARRRRETCSATKFRHWIGRTFRAVTRNVFLGCFWCR